MRICFVAPNAYGRVSGRDDLKQIGGAEVQQCHLARELAARGHRVSFVTWDHGQPDGITHKGITVYKTCARDAGLRGLRFFVPRWTRLAAALERADSDVYYQRIAGAETGQVAAWCRRHGRRFVSAIGNDRDCKPRLSGREPLRERWLYRWGLRRADAVVAQTGAQRVMLERHFGVASLVIPSCAPDPGEAAADRRLRDWPAPPRLLWIGRFSAQKRVDWLIALAERLPEIGFDVVGGGPSVNCSQETGAVRAVAARSDSWSASLKRVPNIRYHGVVPFDQMPSFYEQAFLLVCTSAYEGYPNIFIEAWARGLPVVGTVDPDDVIRSQGLGGTADTVDALAAEVRRLAASTELLRACCRNARAFFLSHHSVSGAVDAYEEKVLRPLVSRPAAIDRTKGGGRPIIGTDNERRPKQTCELTGRQ